MEPVEDFLHEEIIEPEGIGAYKVDMHLRFVRELALQRNLDSEQVWRIR